MKRKPVSVYVNEARYFEVARMVEQALDGAGSLSDFVSFVADRALADFASAVRVADTKPWKRALERFLRESEAHVPYQVWHDDDRERSQRKALAAGLSLALVEPERYRWLVGQLEPASGLPAPLFDLFMLYALETGVSGGLKAFLAGPFRWSRPYAFEEPNELLRQLSEAGQAGRWRSNYPVVWRRDRIDIHPPDKRLERPISVLADPEAFRFVTKAFGGYFPAALVELLGQALAEPGNCLRLAIRIDRLLTFGEVLSKEELDEVGSASRAQRDAFLDALMQMSPRDGLTAEQAQAQKEAILQMMELAGFPPHDYDSMNYERQVEISREWVRRHLKLSSLLPSHQTMGEVVERLPRDPDRPVAFPSPPAYHVLRLFEGYARSVLRDASPARTDAFSLCTLAQAPFEDSPYVTGSLRETLELWSGLRAEPVKAEGEVQWEMRKGKRTALRITKSPDDFWAGLMLDLRAELLNLPPQPELDAWLRQHKVLSIPLNEKVLERLLEVGSRTTLQPATLIAELTGLHLQGIT